jgi:hypothetical protein
VTTASGTTKAKNASSRSLRGSGGFIALPTTPDTDEELAVVPDRGYRLAP